MKLRLRLPKFNGFVIEINSFGWICFLGILIWFVAYRYAPATYPDMEPAGHWAQAIIFTSLVLASILFHELAHIMVAAYYRLPVRRTILYPYGGIMQFSPQVMPWRRTILPAAAGPLASLTLGVILGCIWLVDSRPLTGWLALFNLGFAAFNLLPVQPLDGAHLIVPLLQKRLPWGKAKTLTFVIGENFSLALIYLGCLMFILQQFPYGVLLIYIGGVLEVGARDYLFQDDPRNSQILRQRTLNDIWYENSETQPAGRNDNAVLYWLRKARMQIKGMPMGLPQGNSDGAQIFNENGRVNGFSLLPQAIPIDASLDEAIQKIQACNATTLLIVDGATIIGSCSRDNLWRNMQQDIESYSKKNKQVMGR